jgi:phage FluMu gp28-like protein
MSLNPEELTLHGSQPSREQLAALLKESPSLFLELLTETKGIPTKLEPYQIRFLNDKSKFRLVAKSRQIGFSYIISGEGLHRILTNRSKKVNYVSINQKEASDKVNYAKQFFFSIPELSGFRAPIYTSAEFEFSLHNHPDTSYLISQPASSAVRGGEKDVYFDEFAFIRDARKLYDAAIPATTRGDSRLTIVSTPLGQSGLFFEIANDRARYPEYSVHVVPWWECSIMSIDPAESTALAADYDTPERVNRWGTDSIKSIFNNMGMDSFRQEYECSFADESVNFYPWGLIVNNVDDSLNSIVYDPSLKYVIGIDLAKKVDKTVVTVAHIDEESGIRTIYKTFETQDDYEKQVSFFEKLIKDLKPLRVTVDATGVGAVIAEKLVNSHGGIVEPVVFTQALKEHWATSFKSDLQTGKIRMPRHRDLLHEIHSIERRKSEAGNYLFRARDNEHDDYYWSAMLALYGVGRKSPAINFAW